MQELARADIFFIVTTVAVILVTLVFTIALIYLVTILIEMRHIMQQVRNQADGIAEDIMEMRAKVQALTIGDIIASIFTRGNAKTNKRHDRKKD